MAARKTSKKKAKRPARKAKHLIVWTRVPKGVAIEARGKKSPQLKRILMDAGLDPEAKCFGGDSCIA